MSLRLKFNLAIVAVFIIGFGVTALLLKATFEDSAREEALQTGRVMMAAADAIRRYTTATIEPLIGSEKDGHFLPASVPSFAAQTNFADVSKEFVGYRYKEATLNPTNLTDRATDWEADIINAFRQTPSEQELVTQRDTPLGWSINVARPIKVDEASCLACHSQASVAPISMTKIYGTSNGFGWHTGDIVGSQIISLPLAVPMAKAHRSLAIFLASLTAVFLLMLMILNVLLHFLVVKPVVKISRIATDVSLGNMSAEMFEPTGHDEISVLAEAFNRMRRSLESAIGMLNDQPEAS